MNKSNWFLSIRNWTRIDFDNSNHKFRKQAEKETDQDLQKSPQQLLCDVHEESLNPHNCDDKDVQKLLFNLVLINKRIASLQTKIAFNSSKTSNKALILSIVSIIFVVLSFIPKHNYELDELQAIRIAIESAPNLNKNTINKPRNQWGAESKADLTYCFQCHIPAININNKIRNMSP